MAQPWKFHSLAVAVSNSTQGFAWEFTAVAVVGVIGLDAPALADVMAALLCLESEAGTTDAFGADSVGSFFRKNSVSLPSMRLTKTLNDFPSGPTAIRRGVPCTRSTTGDCFRRLSHG